MKAKTLMIQGTGSGVGKSLLTAAFCRYFFKAGYKVAPFKAQNMALNSFVTEQNKEMGRAQAYQAEACGLKPDVSMNPILLKPSGDNNSQIILMGKPNGSRNAQSYYAQYKKHQQIVLSALNNMRSRYDLIIIEGAGSPVEINLKKTDLVNMYVAEQAEAPVVLVGDIDRGGVFAWMKGTYDLLTKKEQDRVAGFIINKFRGDINLLEPGIKQFENMIPKPVLGVVPYTKNIVIDEEDSIPQSIYSADLNSEDILDIAVMKLPRISNFTDLTPLAHDPSITLRYIDHPEQMGNPDIIIIPGSKNTIGDMNFLNEQGLIQEILKCQKAGTFLLGICGGFQMLGKFIKDPERLEGGNEEVKGLNLFDFETTLEPEKLIRQIELESVKTKIFPGGLKCQGYEIHMGRTKFNQNYQPLFLAPDNENPMNLGITNNEGTIIGTYLHGFLDMNILRQNILRYFRTKKNKVGPEKEFDYTHFRNREFNKLTDLIKSSINMEAISKIIEQ